MVIGDGNTRPQRIPLNRLIDHKTHKETVRPEPAGTVIRNGTYLAISLIQLDSNPGGKLLTRKALLESLELGIIQ